MKTVFTEEMLLLLLKDACEDRKLRHFCRIHDLDPGNVSAIINGKKPMQKAVAKALGYKPITQYVRL